MSFGRIRSSLFPTYPIRDGDRRETKKLAALACSTMCQMFSARTVLNKSFNPKMYLAILQFSEEEH